MTVLMLLLYIVVSALLGGLATWVLARLTPNHPPLIDNIIWVIVVIVIVVLVLSAFGILGSGPMVPRLGGR